MKNRAFTLIELLVVIAIIAILASILFPVFASAKNAAKRTSSTSNVRQVSFAMTLYSQDTDDVTPPLYHYNPSDRSIPSTFGFYYWPVLVLPYTKSEQVFLCPNDRDDDPMLSMGGKGRFDSSNPMHFYVMGANPSYGLNYRYLNQQVFLSAPGANGLPFYYQGVSLTSLGNTSNTIAFSEATMKDLTNPNSGQKISTTIGYSRVEPPSRWTGTYPNARSQGQIWGRFDPKQTIIGWADGHVKVKPINQLIAPGTTAADTDVLWNGLSQ